jgi:hypothetical protein
MREGVMSCAVMDKDKSSATTSVSTLVAMGCGNRCHAGPARANSASTPDKSQSFGSNDIPCAPVLLGWVTRNGIK